MNLVTQEYKSSPSNQVRLKKNMVDCLFQSVKKSAITYLDGFIFIQSICQQLIEADWILDEKIKYQFVNPEI